jgi:hypothetical protein
VVDADTAPVGHADLDFLRSASAQVDKVIFALTKIDRPAGGWRTVAAETEVLLAESMARFASATLVPVSADWAQAASRASTPELASRLLASSGIPALWHELGLLPGRLEELQLANQLRAARSGLELAGQDERRLRTLLGQGADSALAQAEASALRAELGGSAAAVVALAERAQSRVRQVAQRRQPTPD